MLKRLNISLEEDLHRKLKQKASEERTSMENIVAQAPKDYLKNGNEEEKKEG